MMKGKPKGGAAGKVASTTLAYPGNSFKYAPKCPSDKPQQKLTMFEVTTSAIAANIAGSGVTNRQAIGSLVPSTTGISHNELSTAVSDTGPLQRQSRLHSQTCDEINSLSEEDAFVSDGQNQQQLHSEKVIVEVLHRVEKDIQETKNLLKEHTKEVKNGPKRYSNSSVAASEK